MTDPTPSVRRSQELQAIELVLSSVGAQDGGTVQKWFTQGVMGSSLEWMPMILMALTETNAAGEYRWRSADRPLGLIRRIAQRAALNWSPELLFGGDEAVAAINRNQVTRSLRDVDHRFDGINVLRSRLESLQRR